MQFETDSEDGDHPFLTYKARRTMGERTGIISALRGVKTERETYPEVIFSADTADMNSYFSGNENTLHAGGSSPSLKKSAMASVGEVLERYSSRHPVDVLSFERQSATHEEMEKETQVVEFDCIDLYTEEQAKDHTNVQKIRNDTELQWIKGTNIIDGSPLWMPEALVSMSHDIEGKDYFRTCRTSTGLSCGSTPEQALRNSIEEVIERDEIMQIWGTQTTPKQLAVDEYEPLRQIKNRYERDGFETHFLYPSLNTPFHTVLCAQVRKTDRIPKFWLLGASSLSLTDAVKGAAEELAQSYNLAGQRTHEIDTIDDDEYADLVTNVLRYFDPSSFNDVKFLLEGPSVSPDAVDDIDERAIDFEHLTHALDQLNYTPVLFDMTTDGVREAGMCVSRVIIPECLPLSTPNLLPMNHPKFDDANGTSKPHPYP